MDFILKAIYTRETKLNYKFGRCALTSYADWVVMKCYFVDLSTDREHHQRYKADGLIMRVYDKDGNEITEQTMRDYYCIEMIPYVKYRRYGIGDDFPIMGTAKMKFDTADEANAWVKQMLHDKYLNGWKRIK